MADETTWVWVGPIGDGYLARVDECGSVGVRHAERATDAHWHRGSREAAGEAAAAIAVQLRDLRAAALAAVESTCGGSFKCCAVCGLENGEHSNRCKVGDLAALLEAP